MRFKEQILDSEQKQLEYHYKYEYDPCDDCCGDIDLCEACSLNEHRLEIERHEKELKEHWNWK